MLFRIVPDCKDVGFFISCVIQLLLSKIDKKNYY